MGLIDKTQFKATFDYFDKEIVGEIIDIFVKEYPDRIKAISVSIESSNYDDIKFNSHSIKGVIANFVAPDVEQQARQLEMMGAEKNTEGIDSLFAEFKESSAALVEELKELREDYT